MPLRAPLLSLSSNAQHLLVLCTYRVVEHDIGNNVPRGVPSADYDFPIMDECVVVRRCCTLADINLKNILEYVECIATHNHFRINEFYLFFDELSIILCIASYFIVLRLPCITALLLDVYHSTRQQSICPVFVCLCQRRHLLDSSLLLHSTAPFAW